VQTLERDHDGHRHGQEDEDLGEERHEVRAVGRARPRF